jgi:hypothetical protein
VRVRRRADSTNPDVVEWCGWLGRVAALMLRFLPSGLISIESMGAPVGWDKLALWTAPGSI